MTRTMTWRDYVTARDGAGWCYDPARETADRGRVRSFLSAARAMYAYRHDGDAYVDWTPSEFPWDGDAPYDGPLWDATLYVGDSPAASLCCIAADSPRDPYCLVIEGELYNQLDHRREANTVRSVN